MWDKILRCFTTADTSDRKLERMKQERLDIFKGLFIEFSIFVIFQGVDLASSFGVLLNAFSDLWVFKSELKAWPRNYDNGTEPFAVGICTNLEWEPYKLSEMVEGYEKRVVFLAVIGIILATSLFAVHFFLWIFVIQQSIRSSTFFNRYKELLYKWKARFTAAASFIQDIPLSSIAVELYALRSGTEGLMCWYCTANPGCSSERDFEELLSSASRYLYLNLAAITTVTLWKSITTFYRWSRIDQISSTLFYLRACTSLFVGVLYVLVILTPAMMLLKMRYFTLPGVTETAAYFIIDRIYFIGIIFWVVFILVGIFFPLLNAIKLK